MTRDVPRLEGALAAKGSRTAEVFSGIRRLVEWRSHSAAFHPESPQTVLDSRPELFAIERGAPGGPRARVYVNVSSTDITTPIAGREGVGPVRFERRGTGAVRLGPWEYVWLTSETLVDPLLPTGR